MSAESGMVRPTFRAGDDGRPQASAAAMDAAYHV